MQSILIDALLRSCPNPVSVLDTLCWPRDTLPDVDRVRAVTALVERLGDTPGGHPLLVDKLSMIVWQLCLPLLEQLGEDEEEVLLGALCCLSRSCVLSCGEDALERLARMALSALQPTGASALCAGVAVELLSTLLPELLSGPRALQDELLSLSARCACHAPQPLSSRCLVRVLAPLLLRDTSGHAARHFWAELGQWHEEERVGGREATSRALLCLTALCDQLLVSEGNPCCSPQFWGILQAGLTHCDSVSRKRAVYLLKRSVALSQDEGVNFCCPPSAPQDQGLFTWIPEHSQLLRTLWEDYILVMETLDENQIHVIRPVLKRMDTLIGASGKHEGEATLLHPTWVLCVYQRMFHNENKTVMREGVSHLLEMKGFHSPTFTRAFSQFIVGPLMDVLTDTSLFQRLPGQNIGDCPAMLSKLQGFMVSFFSVITQEERTDVMLQLLSVMASRQQSSISTLVLCLTLSYLPGCPCLGAPGLHALREVLCSAMITHQVQLRGASQCFLLHSALSHIDVSCVTLAEVFGFLVHFRADESLCRGTILWNQVCRWLADHEGSFKPDPLIRKGDASPQTETLQMFVRNRLDSFLRVPPSSDPPGGLLMPDHGEAELLARAVLLTADVERMRKMENGQKESCEGSDSCGLDQLLLPLLDTLQRLGTSVYLPTLKTDRSLQLFLRLLQLCNTRNGNDAVLVAMETAALNVSGAIQEFILRRLGGELCELCDVERAALYHSVLRQLHTLGSCTAGRHRSHRHGFIPALTAGCLRTLEQPVNERPTLNEQVTRAVAMATLALLCKVGEEHGTHLHPEALQALSSISAHFCSFGASRNLIKPAVSNSSLQGAEDGLPLQGWGRLAAQFARDQWTCLRFALWAGHVSEISYDAPLVLGAALEMLSLLPSDLVLPVLDCMAFLVPLVVLLDERLCVQAVTLAWKLVQGLSGNQHDFWPSLERFVRFAFNCRILQLTRSEAPALTATLHQIAKEMIELSEAKTGVFSVLIQHCCRTWLPPDPGSVCQTDVLLSSAIQHINILTEACIHGPVFRKDQRITQEIQAYVESLGEACSANLLVNSDCRDEQLPRVCVLAFLSRLDPSWHIHARLMEELAGELLRKDEEIAKSKVRYHSNSLQHRVKNRVWQTLLVLLPKLSEEFTRSLLGRVYQAGFCSNQASVKYLIEWAIVLLLHRHPAQMDSLWTCFSADQEKTKTSICTFLSVLVHLDVFLPKIKDKARQWWKAVDVALQWCFSHNFSVRLYALLALKRVWGLGGVARGDGDGSDGVGSLAPVVEACLQQAEALQSAGNAMKNWTRIQDHFFFSTFHPLKDYSIETIVHTFPKLSELADDEWISTSKFERLVEFSQNPLLPLCNSRRDLSQQQPGNWVQQDKGELEREERWAEVQKKISPWRLSIEEQEAELQPVPQFRAARLGKCHSNLLVVASLIDKPTNLGGLCRTCEIFGARGLVLDNLRHTNDKNFQALSVSSELWLPLLEARPAELAAFLQEKQQQEGYCIVGVEQTANSQSLQDFSFPEKTLLLLGNEREGIPANLLQLLDVCVEIPQVGITRSLNVHVSAALLVWEYNRQHMTPGSAGTLHQGPPAE